MRSKLTDEAARRAASSSAGVAMASVVRTTSMVASAGASIPAPLAMPETCHPSPAEVACLDTESVVMIAVAAASWPCGVSEATAAATPGRSRSIGSRSPMSPVEHTATSPAEIARRSATCSAVRCVSRKPGDPVQALAPPELSTTASTRPSVTTCLDHVTGAASTRLLVKTAAAAWSGPSLTTSARSGRPLALRPAVTPAARNPRGRLTVWVVMGRLRRGEGQWSRAGPARGWRTGSRHRPCLW